MGHRIGLAIGPLQRGHEQDAARQRLGVASAGDGHIQAGARAPEGGQLRGHHHRSYILHLDGGRSHGQTLTYEHVGQGLGGELGLVLVAGAIQTHHHAEAHELVAPDALEVRHVAQLGVNLLFNRHDLSTHEGQGRQTYQQQAHGRLLEGPDKVEQPADIARLQSLVHHALAPVADAELGHL